MVVIILRLKQRSGDKDHKDRREGGDQGNKSEDRKGQPQLDNGPSQEATSGP